MSLRWLEAFDPRLDFGDLRDDEIAPGGVAFGLAVEESANLVEREAGFLGGGDCSEAVGRRLVEEAAAGGTSDGLNQAELFVVSDG